MENKDASTGYWKVVRVAVKKWKMIEITIEIIFCLFEIRIQFFI